VSNFSFKNRYLLLGEAFYEKCKPTPVDKPEVIIFNNELAAELGVTEVAEDDLKLTAMFSGNQIHESCEPLAMAYAGHQFGSFNPQLGDGRAIYLGELDLTAGESLDVQLKGSGPTRYSRNGDGRSALGPVLREYLLSEAMHKLGVPTTRALAAVSTGEEVPRDRLSPGGVITRVASGFIRVGSFEYFARQNDMTSVKKLADYVIERNYRGVSSADNPYLAFFEAVVMRQAGLIAKWMQFGFIHGVMNTDNMSVAGETIDYGPCAFMDFYNHKQVYSSIDHQGRYAYDNQPHIGGWNLTRLAECLLPLFSDEPDEAVKLAQDILKSYVNAYANDWLSGFREKCGLTAVEEIKAEDDKVLIESLLDIMDENRADFTLTFYYLSQCNAEPDKEDIKLQQLFKNQDEISTWLISWRQRLAVESKSNMQRQQSMQLVNPVCIPRNHQIEAVIRAAEDRNDFTPFHTLHAVLENPFQYQKDNDAYMQPPVPEQIVQQTFCGT